MSDELALVLRATQDPSVRYVVEAISDSSPGREVSGIVSDKIRGYRVRTQVKVLQKTAKAIEDAGLEPHAVPVKTLAPLLEHASLEEAEEMVDRWANLLANAATAGSTSGIPPSFPDILRQLEPTEARLTENLIRERHRRRKLNYKEMRYIDLDLGDIEGHDDISWAQLDNLERLGLIQYSCDLPLNVAPPKQPTQVRLSETPLGEAFVDACQPPQSSR